MNATRRVRAPNRVLPFLIAGALFACGPAEPAASLGAGGQAGAAGGQSTGGSGATALDAGADDASAGWIPPTEPLSCDGAGARFVTAAVATAFGPGQSVGQDRHPEPILGPPRGAGCCEGSLDVVSLGNGGMVTVEFAGNGIVDGPGPDFVVFENAFFVGGDEALPFAELATVEVSEDGVNWHAFPCVASSPPYGTCAGWRPVFSHPDNGIDPLDPSVSGGDPFDLADIGVESARYVRITDRADQQGQGGVFDLDAVAIISPACP